MSKVLVFDVAASSRGAMSVLKSFYTAIIGREENDWIFVLSDKYLEEKSHIRVLSFPDTKKNWFHRLWFDYVKAPQLVAQENPDVVLSLQNVTVPFVHKKRVTFLHQSIPFSDIHFSLKKNRIEWVYQNIIAHFIYRSLKKSDLIVVQTKWMKKAVADKLKINEGRIVVSSPTVTIREGIKYKDTFETRKCFFYPSAYAEYKNHSVILEAVRILSKQGREDFKVLMTVTKDKLGDISDIERNVVCLGNISFDEVMDYYSKSVLVFPSLLETFGLPLAEAGLIGSPIIAADMPYAREILDQYSNAVFFDPSKPENLADCMLKSIDNVVPYFPDSSESLVSRFAHSNWDELIQRL